MNKIFIYFIKLRIALKLKKKCQVFIFFLFVNRQSRANEEIPTSDRRIIACEVFIGKMTILSFIYLLIHFFFFWNYLEMFERMEKHIHNFNEMEMEKYFKVKLMWKMFNEKVCYYCCANSLLRKQRTVKWILNALKCNSIFTAFHEALFCRKFCSNWRMPLMKHILVLAKLVVFSLHKPLKSSSSKSFKHEKRKEARLYKT